VANGGLPRISGVWHLFGVEIARFERILRMLQALGVEGATEVPDLALAHYLSQRAGVEFPWHSQYWKLPTHGGPMKMSGAYSEWLSARQQARQGRTPVSRVYGIPLVGHPLSPFELIGEELTPERQTSTQPPEIQGPPPPPYTPRNPLDAVIYSNSSNETFLSDLEREQRRKAK
jgi:hypothetical protein